MFCPQCGKENPPQARFCHDCGSALPTDAPSQAPQDASAAPAGPAAPAQVTRTQAAATPDASELFPLLLPRSPTPSKATLPSRSNRPAAARAARSRS